MSPRCVPVRFPDGTTAFALAASPLTVADREAIDQFRATLREAYVSEHDQSQPAPADALDGTVLPPGAVDLTPLAGWVMVLHDVEAKRETLKDVEAQARAHIAALMGDAVDGRLGGIQVVRYGHVAAKTTFDRKRFEQENPGVLRPYLKTGAPSRNFKLLDGKGES